MFSFTIQIRFLKPPKWATKILSALKCLNLKPDAQYLLQKSGIIQAIA